MKIFGLNEAIGRFKFERKVAAWRKRYAAVSRGVRTDRLSFDVPARPNVFMVCADDGWHSDLISSLRSIADLTLFDQRSFEALRQGPRALRKLLPLRVEWNQKLIDDFSAACDLRKVDICLFYVNANILLIQTIDEMRRVTGGRVPFVNISFDDKNFWEAELVGGQRCGYRDIAACFDLYWTSSIECVSWLRSVGAHPIYMPEAANASVFKGRSQEAAQFDVVFVGAKYGFRPRWLEALRGEGLAVHTFGVGWNEDSFIARENLGALYRRTKVILGHGGAAWSERITNVKAREFEVAMAGGGIYITSFNPDLATHFQHGVHMLFYRDNAECAELVRWSLQNPQAARTIALAAQEWSVERHDWVHRLRSIFGVLGGRATFLEATARTQLPEMKLQQ
jgi:hypothetical protein